MGAGRCEPRYHQGIDTSEENPARSISMTQFTSSVLKLGHNRLAQGVHTGERGKYMLTEHLPLLPDVPPSHHFLVASSASIWKILRSECVSF